MLPNFLIIGAARSGTTSVYSALQAHPDVYLPVNKRPEPHFFLKEAEFAKGLPYYEQRYFADWNGQRAVGEASTSYLFGADVPRRIHAALPEAKLICILRNPIDRAFSGYWHSVVSGLEPLSFEEAIAREDDRKRELDGTALGEIAPFAYVERGLYHRQLQGWFKVFDRSRMRIMIFDDLLREPKQSMSGVAQFLEIDPGGFQSIELQKENTSAPAGAAMSPDLRRSLTERFRHDIVALQDLLRCDLTSWLAAPGQ